MSRLERLCRAAFTPAAEEETEVNGGGPAVNVNEKSLNKTGFKPCPGRRRLYSAELARTWRWVCRRSPPHSERCCGCSAGCPPTA